MNFSGASVSSLQFRNDGQYLASGHNDGSVRLVDLKSGAESVLRREGNSYTQRRIR